MSTNSIKKKPKKTFSMKADEQRELLGFRDFLMHRFLVILFYLIISEFTIKLLLDAFLIPPIQGAFFQNSTWDSALSLTQVFVFVIMVFGQFILTLIASFVPSSGRGIIQLWLSQLQDWATEIVPEIGDNPGVSQIEIWEVLLLFIGVFVVILLFAAPLLLATLWFAQIVTKEVRRMERQKEEVRLEYERKRNLMLSDIAHDLRTPITTIAGYSKALNDGMVTEEKKRTEYLEAIENKSARMNDLINLLFEYVKLDSEGFVLNLESVDLPELLRENAALLYSDIEEKSMKFEINIPEDTCTLNLDSVQFSRVITNLVTNAIRHNETGTTIYLSMERKGEFVEVIVADNGTPIPHNLAMQIFEPFAMGDTSRKSKGGSGLGLSIAKKIVEMHGGTLKFEQNTAKHLKSFTIQIKYIL